MAVSTSVYLARARLPTAHAWQRILDDAGLPLLLDTGVNLHDFAGLLPVRYRGQESGFEYFLEHDVQPPDAVAAFGPGQLDTCVTLVARSSLEARAAAVAAAALAALTGGVANTFTLFLAPAFAGQVFLVIMLPVFIGETSLSLWLLIKGVNADRWHQAAATARLSP